MYVPDKLVHHGFLQQGKPRRLYLVDDGSGVVVAGALGCWWVCGDRG